jgi:transcriptional regulator with XRE-family HTH domain
METIPMCTTVGTPLPADLSQRLRKMRKYAGLSAEQAALETGLSARVIGDFERGYRVPRLAYLRVLAALYSVPITAFIDAEPLPEEVAAGVA